MKFFDVSNGCEGIYIHTFDFETGKITRIIAESGHTQPVKLQLKKDGYFDFGWCAQGAGVVAKKLKEIIPKNVFWDETEQTYFVACTLVERDALNQQLKAHRRELRGYQIGDNVHPWWDTTKTERSGTALSVPHGWLY